MTAETKGEEVTVAGWRIDILREFSTVRVKETGIWVTFACIHDPLEQICMEVIVVIDFHDVFPTGHGGCPPLHETNDAAGARGTIHLNAEIGALEFQETGIGRRVVGGGIVPQNPFPICVALPLKRPQWSQDLVATLEGRRNDGEQRMIGVQGSS
jgi:hypothetical protein